MQTRSMTAAFLLTTTAALSPGCAPEPGSCGSALDCAFGQVCSDEGLCTVAGGGGGGFAGQPAGGDGMGGGGGGLAGQPAGGDGMGGDTSSLGSLVSSYSSTGRFTGRIGGDAVDVATVKLDVYASGFSAWFMKPGASSTFLVIQSAADITTPGVRSVATDLFTEVARACNYDTTAYDESFPSYEVEVSPPRDATADDPIIAEDTVTTVVDVKIAVAGEGSEVTVDFAMPVE